MTITKHKWLVALVILPVVILAAIIGIMVGFVPGRAPLPHPNGYDDLVKAGEEVSGPVSSFFELDYDKLEDLVSVNAEPLRLLRLGLTRSCRVPTDSALTNTPGLMNDLAGMKRLAQLLAAEGRLRELDNQPEKAAQSYMDAIRLGNEMSRGGLLITRLVGIACEAIGYQALGKVAPNLSREEDHVIQAQLEQVDANRVTWAEVKESEQNCARYHFRNHLNPITLMAGWWQSRQAIEKAEVRHKTAIAHERLLVTDLALRCYQRDKAQSPACLDELVTNYLSKLPQDPFNGKPFIYRPQIGTSWLIYSVGPDGVDDGGKPARRGWPVKGDILVDSAW